ncbi:MAG TPA: hypothetical protein VEA80_14375 [Vitreimonas sp.]|uniref:hypothetical protein n=1 Tax=Vitreimonas sp. TaxID=3069702 RepID=UPI002D236B89|nr:hypothetical protein [Vitreimonas sp.]HYD88657.1 hypothetical protein [Vitreimonas sp.]
MAWFRVFACGENFPVDIEGEVILCGFYTTRYVEAASASEAETIASELLFDDPDLETPRGYEDLEEQASIRFEEVEQVAEPIDIDENFSFFPMEEDEED